MLGEAVTKEFCICTAKKKDGMVVFKKIKMTSQ